MTTTIQISDTTKQLLETMKGDDKTYDEVIKSLAEKKERIPRSMRGTLNWGPWDKEKDRMKFKHE